MALDDPTSEDNNILLAYFEIVFLGFYTLEILLKIIGMGFILNKGSFMRDGMNLLDFFIVFMAYL